MNEIKYEAVFGDQSLFDGDFAETAFLVIKFKDGRKSYMSGEFDDTCIGFTTDGYIDIAMRRIVKAPTWTKADQLAGRLPEVGSLVKEKISNGLCGYKCVVKCIFDGEICIQFDDGSFRIDTINGIEPIESLEEKAQRLKVEWCKSVREQYYPRGNLSIESQIYDALLSGELKAPGVE